MNWRIDKDKIFYWLLGLSAAVIPMPGNQYSSFSIILLLVCWIALWDWKGKFNQLKENKIKVFCLMLPFMLAVLGLIYTDDLHNGMRRIQLLLPFLAYPLILFSIKPEKNLNRFVFYCFSFGTFLAALMGIGKAFYYRINTLGDYFFYSRFAELVDKHTTYFSLFIVLSLLFLLKEFLRNRLKWFVLFPLVVFFLFVLYIVSARISIVALAIGSLIVVFSMVQSKLKWILLLLPLLLVGLFSLPNFQKRFDVSETEKGEMSDFEFREFHWKSVLETIENNPFLIGGGTGANRDFLYGKYKEYQLTSAYELEYNAHNQFLEITLDYGLLGLILFLAMLIMVFLMFWKAKAYFSIAILSVFLIYFLTESLFQRHDGIVCFALLLSVLLYGNKSKP